MGMPLVVLAKINMVSRSLTFSPLVWSLMLPFVVKLLIQSLRGAFDDAVYPCTFFIFQLRRITSGNGDRWGRAARLVHARLSGAASSSAPTLDDEDSLHTLSMLAL